MMQRVDDVVEPERREDSVLELSRFACKSTKSSSRPPPPSAPGPSRPAVATKTTPGHLTDSQLVQLSKCICCRLQWTNRKTTKQKRTHIEQCAKKNALNNDTIRVLVDKEIANLSPAQNTASTGDTNGITTATLMDSVVPAGSVKKYKRQQVIATVKSLPETRDSIMDRARDILGSTKGQADLKPTRQFGQSALPRRNTKRPGQRHPALLDENTSTDEPPSPTQPFGGSSLRGGIAERSVNGCEGFSSQKNQQFGGSMFDQDSVLSSDRHKRPASPDNNCRDVRQRLQ